MIEAYGVNGWRTRMDEKRLASLQDLEKRLGYQFKERGWLDRALTHKSFVHQTHTRDKVSNEVLEYLGDAVLNLAVSHLLLQAFPEAQEGTLSMWRAHLVKRSSLAFLSKQLRLDQYLLFGKSEILDGGAKKTSILANAYEAVVGAIYLDSGYDRALEIVRHHLEPYLGLDPSSVLSNDYKSLLQKITQKTFGFTPRYHVLRESGPDHDKQFQASVLIGGELKGTGWGRNKKEAEQEAAKNALKELDASVHLLNSK